MKRNKPIFISFPLLVLSLLAAVLSCENKITEPLGNLYTFEGEIKNIGDRVLTIGMANFNFVEFSNSSGLVWKVGQYKIELEGGQFISTAKVASNGKYKIEIPKNTKEIFVWEDLDLNGFPSEVDGKLEETWLPLIKNNGRILPIEQIDNEDPKKITFTAGSAKISRNRPISVNFTLDKLPGQPLKISNSTPVQGAKNFNPLLGSMRISFNEKITVAAESSLVFYEEDSIFSGRLKEIEVK